MKQVTRREVLRTTAAGAAAIISAAGCSESQTVGGRADEAVDMTVPPLGPDEPIRTAFIGVGGRGTGLLQAFLKQKGQQVVAICDINADNLKRAVGLVEKAQSHTPDTYGEGPDDFKRVLDRRDIHAIVTATPCFEHARIMLATLAAGKHIYGEKPLALNVRDCDALLAASRARPRLVVQVGFQWMASPRFIETISRIHSGELGELIEGRFFRHNKAPALKGWFSFREKSGDWMLEQACHEYNVMNWVAQTTPIRAFGMGRRGLFTEDDPQRDVTDYYAAIIEYPNNFIVHYAHGWISPDGFSEMAQKVLGTKGAVEIGGQRIASIKRGEKLPPLSSEGGDDTAHALRAFLTSIREGKPSIAPVSYGRNASLLALLVRKAVDERRSVTWDEMLRTC